MSINKYEVTQEDRDIMANDMKTDRTLKHIRNLSFYKFTVGDVLVRQEKRWLEGDRYEWRTCMHNNLPYKYVYVFENELGVGYIRRLSVNGSKFVERPMCVTEFDPDTTQFALDPEYADHMLLAPEDEEFDTKSRYAEAKRKRERVHRQNKKLALKWETEADVIKWMETLKPGDQFWWGYNISSINKDAYYVHKINLVEPPDFKKTHGGYWGAQFQPNIEATTSPTPPSAGGPGFGYSNQLYASNLVRYYVFTQKPFFQDEQIS